MISDAENQTQLQYTCYCYSVSSWLLGHRLVVGHSVCTSQVQRMASVWNKCVGNELVAYSAWESEEEHKNTTKAKSSGLITQTLSWHTDSFTNSHGLNHAIHPSSPLSRISGWDGGGSSTGLAHDRWRWWWDCCWVWAALCVWDLPAKVGQKGTPTASLFVIPCMALCGSLGSTSSFSQE